MACLDAVEEAKVARLGDGPCLAQLDETESSRAASTSAPERKRGSRGKRHHAAHEEELERLKALNAELIKRNEQLQAQVQDLERRREHDSFKLLSVLGKLAEERRRRGAPFEASDDELLGQGFGVAASSPAGSAYSSSDDRAGEDAEDDEDEAGESECAVDASDDGVPDDDALCILVADLKLQIDALQKLLRTPEFKEHASNEIISKLSGLHGRALGACGMLATPEQRTLNKDTVTKWICIL